jgi:hypothetical protein
MLRAVPMMLMPVNCSTTSPKDPRREPSDECAPPPGAVVLLDLSQSVAGEELLLVQRPCTS